ncbi:MAG TPA: Crp/Fnr family transcriptional regulator [Caulobacteraceae bacterium]|jgi:CRP-like cAMP-binding protein
MVEYTRGDVIANGFLRALPPDALTRLRPHLEPVELVRRQSIYAAGEDPAYIYFPIRGLVSLVKAMSDGRVVEVGAVGVEGAVCLSGLLALPETVFESLVQLPGAALRIKSALFRDEAARDPGMADVVRRYVAVSLGQIAQTAACNRLHSLEERCCRWLLLAHDSARDDTFQLTHEFLALMLGVQRPGVTITARALQRAGLINYQNGRVTVADRPGLEANACECYAAVRHQYEALVERR